MADVSVVDRARGMRDLGSAEAAESERLRTLSPAIVDEMWASGLMVAFNPKAAGGVEPSFHQMIDTWIEMAWQDGSFGWIGIANLPSTFAAATYLPDEGFDEIFTRNDSRITIGGQYFPNGQGTAVDGGYRLNGAWSFGSGTGHSAYIGAGFFPMDNGEMRWVSEGIPDMRVAFLPREEVNFTDGWHVQGLKGTGSYDYNVADVFVPEYRTMPLFAREPFRRKLGGQPDGTDAHHRCRPRLVRPGRRQEHARRCRGTRGHQGADERYGHAGKPSDLPEGSRPPRRCLAGGSAAGDRCLSTAEAAVDAGNDLTPQLRADMRVAAVYATDTARAAAEWAHLAAGTTAIREGNRLERAFRDIYTGTQHAFISEKVAMDVAQIWLGIIDDQFGL